MNGVCSELESPGLGRRRQVGLCRLEASLGHMRPCPNKELEWKIPTGAATPALDRCRQEGLEAKGAVEGWQDGSVGKGACC